MSKKITNQSKKLSFTVKLIEWGRLNGRKNLPWSPPFGGVYDPYKVWVSEIMLQQTKLKTGIKHFKNFMLIFPSVEELAKSKLEKVLFAWVGLGYYARAKNLHRSALMISSEKQTYFPKCANEWIKLPGVGFSTAASISAFVNHERVPVMDANVIRVFARQFMLKELQGSVGLKNKILPIASRFLPLRSVDMPIYTQSIMDLGATICLPRNPKCTQCPVSSSCCSNIMNQTNSYPMRKIKMHRERKKINWLIPYTNDSIALTLLKSSRLWEGLWTPIQIINKDQIPNEAHLIKKFETPISNFRLEVSLWAVLCTDKSIYNSVRWFNFKDLLKIPVPTTVKKALSSTSFYL